MSISMSNHESPSKKTRGKFIPTSVSEFPLPEGGEILMKSIASLGQNPLPGKITVVGELRDVTPEGAEKAIEFLQRNLLPPGSDTPVAVLRGKLQGSGESPDSGRYFGFRPCPIGPDCVVVSYRAFSALLGGQPDADSVVIAISTPSSGKEIHFAIKRGLFS